MHDDLAARHIIARSDLALPAAPVDAARHPPSLIPLIANALAFQQAVNRIPAAAPGTQEGQADGIPENVRAEVLRCGAALGFDPAQSDNFIHQHRYGNISTYSEFAALNNALHVHGAAPADIADTAVKWMDPGDVRLVARLAEINPVIAGHAAIVLGQLRDSSSLLTSYAERGPALPLLYSNLSALEESERAFEGIDRFAGRLRRAMSRIPGGREFIDAWRHDVMRPLVEAVSVCITQSCTAVREVAPIPTLLWYWPVFPIERSARKNLAERWHELACAAPPQLWNYLDPGRPLQKRYERFRAQPRESIPSVVGADDPGRFITWIGEFFSSLNEAFESTVRTPGLFREHGCNLRYGDTVTFVLRSESDREGQARFGINLFNKAPGADPEPFSLRVDRDDDGTLALDFGSTSAAFMIEHSLKTIAPVRTLAFQESLRAAGEFYKAGGTRDSEGYAAVIRPLCDITRQVNFLRPGAPDFARQIAHFATMMTCIGELQGGRRGPTVSHHQRESLHGLSLRGPTLPHGTDFKRIVTFLRDALRHPAGLTRIIKP